MRLRRPGLPVWGDPADSDPFPPLTGAVRADVCVVGLGGSGLAAIDELTSAGATVVGLDAGPVGGGAAGRNAGFLLAGLADFHHVAVGVLGRERAAGLYRLTLAELDRLEVDLPSLVRRRGSVRVARDEEETDDLAAHAESLAADGFPGGLVGPSGGARLVVPSDGEVDPLARCRLVAARAAVAGARLYTNSPALDVSGDRVRAPAGEVACTAVVVAVDGGLETLLPELTASVRSTRLQMLATSPGAAAVADQPVYARYGYDYHRQLADGRVVLGGARDRHDAAEWGALPEPSGPVQADLDALLADLGVDAPVTHRWAGVVAYTADRLPVLAEVRPGVVAVGGYCGTGNVVGPIAAQAAAAIVLGRRAPLAARLLRPEHWDR